ncbi:MAG: hypothetical protein FJ106_09245 [Deltaproteobacteria bacterium]|nr:hypothetical protein [Deltaproteobacteria bacterium]
MGKISWDKGKTQFLGRNGYFGCTGFEFERLRFPKGDQKEQLGFLGDVVRVYPVTTKEERGRCFIEIPTLWAVSFSKALRAETGPKSEKEEST